MALALALLVPLGDGITRAAALPPPATPAAAQSAPPSAPPPPPAQFAEALEAIRRGDLGETARLCWAYLKSREAGQQQGEAGSSDKAESATFYLGEALERLGYIHAAIDFYTEIVTERRAPQLVPRALGALERISRTHGYDEEAIAQSGILTVAEFEELPPRLQSFIHYRQAVDDLRRGYDGWAFHHLGRIGADTPYLPMALYARAVWHLSKGEGDAALADLGQVIAHRQTPPDVLARALHARARLLYERGKWGEAYADLDKVDVRYEPGGDVLMEKAWAKYRAGDFRIALGLLHALGAPSYVNGFAPERYLLRSLIFGKYCHFRAAKRSIELFRQRFTGELAALRGGNRPEEVTPLRGAAFERTSYTGAGAQELLLQRLSEEQRRLQQAVTWGGASAKGSLGQYLAELYDIKIRGVRHREEQLLHEAAERVASELLDANEQMNLLEYEVGLGIYRRVGRAQEVKLSAQEAPRKLTIPRVSDQVYYHFEGEYWTDELPDMQFFIEDRCVD